jgi:hypothetical protein
MVPILSLWVGVTSCFFQLHRRLHCSAIQASNARWRFRQQALSGMASRTAIPIF